MTRALHKLKARTVETLKEPGRHSDGGGLYLVVDKPGPAPESKPGGKRWVFLFRRHGKLKEMGLGGLSETNGLATARGKAAEARKIIEDGGDPIALRRSERAVPTFGKFADELIADLSGGWRNPKHVAQWKMTLEVYAKPLREKPVNEITTDHVLSVLRPIWSSKQETAGRLRGRIERVLDAAKAKGHREGENPARWKGHLDHLLPKQSKLSRGHHAAMPYDEVPAFVALLGEGNRLGAVALEFTILCAARTTETLEATWSEIDLDAKVWTIPPARMKAGREHRVPLSARAVAILEQMAKARINDFVFPGMKKDRPLSNMTLDKVMRDKAPDYTVHGFRSSFRDWCAEETSTPREIAEAALAHAVGDLTERAYRRGDALEKRRKLMDAWAEFCSGSETSGGVTSEKGEEDAA
jgi:integrase